VRCVVEKYIQKDGHHYIQSGRKLFNSGITRREINEWRRVSVVIGLVDREEVRINLTISGKLILRKVEEDEVE
jgi:hypothetical protein